MKTMDEEVQEVDDDRLGLLPQSSHRKRPPPEDGGNFRALKFYCQNETSVFIFSFLCLVVVLFVVGLSKVKSNDAVVAAFALGLCAAYILNQYVLWLSRAGDRYRQPLFR